MTLLNFTKTLQSLFFTDSSQLEVKYQPIMKKSFNGVYVKVEPTRLGLQLEKDRKKRKEWTDVQLKIGDKLFHAHRVVLSRHSPVLKAMTSKKWFKDIYPISDEYVDVEIVEDLLSFFYTGSIKLTPDNVFPVCMAAHFLQISTILEPSVNYLCQLIDTENVFKLFEFSTTFELKTLNFACLKFVKLNQKVLFNDQAILELSVNVFKDLIVGLKDHFCDTVLRENTFWCIVLWIERTEKERSKYLRVLLKNLPLEELPRKFLIDTVFKHPLVEYSITGVQTANRAYSRSSKIEQNMIVLGGTKKIHSKWGEGERLVESQTMNCYNSSTGVWSRLPDMPSQCSGSGAIVVNQQDIIVRGRKNTTKSIHMFDWISQTWTKLPKMPYRLTDILMAELNGHLYVAGIRRHVVACPTMLCYSFETKQWKWVKPMNTIPQKSLLVSCKNYLYALSVHSRVIEKYDPTENQWREVGRMRNSGNFAATTHEGKIYVCGFRGLEVYYPESNVCNQLSMEITGSGASLVSVNGKLLSVGATFYFNKLYDVSDSIFEFDFSEGRWSKCGRMESELKYHSALAGAFY